MRTDRKRRKSGRRSVHPKDWGLTGGGEGVGGRSHWRDRGSSGTVGGVGEGQVEGRWSGTVRQTGVPDPGYKETPWETDPGDRTSSVGRLYTTWPPPQPCHRGFRNEMGFHCDP